MKKTLVRFGKNYRIFWVAISGFQLVKALVGRPEMELAKYLFRKGKLEGGNLRNEI